MKKIIIPIMLVIFFMSFLNAYDQQLPQICGGDSELLISCLGDQELIFVGGLPPSAGGGSRPINITLKEEIPEPLEVSPLFSIFPFLRLEPEELILYIILVIFLMSILILAWKKRKDMKQKEKKRRENMKEEEGWK